MKFLFYIFIYIMALFGSFNKYYKSLNNSKLLSGLAMIILNIFSKYVELNISKTQESYIRNAITREILIFTVIFVGTRDIITSLLLTAAFIILSTTIFNERSRMCIIPNKYIVLQDVLDTNKDKLVSDDEIKNAREILNKANIQKNKVAQITSLNYFQDNI
jgi:chromate transport protein ChrA